MAAPSILGFRASGFKGLGWFRVQGIGLVP